MSHISAADYEEFHESRESLCAPECVPVCELCHEDNATEIVEDEGRQLHVCDYCAKAIAAFNSGKI